MKIFKTKVFKNGGSLAIRIPAALRSDAGELYIWAGDDRGSFTVSTKPPVDRETRIREWVEARSEQPLPDWQDFTDIIKQSRSDDTEYVNPFDEVVDAETDAAYEADVEGHVE